MMLTLQEMLIRLLVAVLLGAVVGWEREMVGKGAGIRTNIVVAAGAALFTLASLMSPYVFGLSDREVVALLIQNGGYLRLMSNVAVGIGFLGAGIIIQQGTRVRGLTTAATVWLVAAVGVLAGLGLLQLAAISAIGITLILLALRKIDLYKLLDKKKNPIPSKEVEGLQEKARLDSRESKREAKEENKNS